LAFEERGLPRYVVMVFFLSLLERRIQQEEREIGCGQSD